MTQNIAIIGVGRLGICAALIWEKSGFNVLGSDISESYVNSLNNKTFQSPEPQVSQLLKDSKNFRATLSLDEALAFSNIIYIFVDTPTGIGKKSYDHSKLSKVLDSINDRAVANKHIVIGCTVLPGYINTTGRYLLRDCPNCSLSYNPEFIAQGDIINGFWNPDLVLIGEGSKEAGDAMEYIYKKCCKSNPSIHRMSPSSAEITKLSINCFITTKISFSNMVADIADRTDEAEKHKILEAVGSDSRIGSKYLKPGYGYGGPCFPRDNRALGNYASSVGVDPVIPQATDTYNRLHAQYMTEAFLAQKQDHYVFEDIAYKSNCPVPIIEESQKLEVAQSLAKQGKKVEIVDRKDIIKEVQREYGNLFSYTIKQ